MKIEYCVESVLLRRGGDAPRRCLPMARDDPGDIEVRNEGIDYRSTLGGPLVLFSAWLMSILRAVHPWCSAHHG
jgi:hypothetical protein